MGGGGRWVAARADERAVGVGRVNKRVDLYNSGSISQILARPEVLTCSHRAGSSQKNRSAHSSEIV